MTEITVSVRNLVEFLLRNGDIDSSRRGSSEDAMQAGNRIHKKIQKQAGPGYEAEVHLSVLVPYENFAVRVEGRADGVITDKDGNITIDEIKGTYRHPDSIKEPDPVHLAQAMCYAYIVLTAENLEEITVQMTYCNLETEQIKRFKQTLTAEEITNWFKKLMEEYGRWATFQVEWEQTMKESVSGLSFPFSYRDGQEELIEKCRRAYRDGKMLFLEAPTGCGKTVTTLYPAVKSLGDGLHRRIFYLTAKTIARTVAADTLNTLREKSLRLKSIVLTAKDKICILDEDPECNPSACVRAAGHYDRVNDAIFALITSEDEWTREVIEEYAEKYRVCPFEFSLDVSLFADAVICDYNYVYDPHVYLRRFFAEGSRDACLFLVDEAHNLVDRARDMYSARLVKEDMQALAVLLEETCIGKRRGPIPSKYAIGIRNALEECATSFLLAKRKCDDGFYVYEDEDLFAPQLQALSRFASVMQHYLEEDEERRNGKIRKAVLNFYFEVSHFQLMWELKEDDFVLFSQIEDDGNFSVKLFCIHPGRLLKNAHSMSSGGVLFSATLYPMEYYKTLLGGRRDDPVAQAKSIFPVENRLILTARDVTSRFEDRTEENYERIAGYVYHMVKAQKGNYMVFFPSFEFAQKVSEVLFRKYAPIVFDVIEQKENMNEAEREEFLSRFRKKDKNEQSGQMSLFASDALLPDLKDAKNDSKNLPVIPGMNLPGKFKRSMVGFCVIGGIFAEGIDLTGDELIGAAVVGGGIPYVTRERELIREYFDEDGGRGFEYAYRIPGINKVLQAAGRVIRTENDRGIILYLEKRFLKAEYEGMFPEHMNKDAVVDEKIVGMMMGKFWKQF